MEIDGSAGGHDARWERHAMTMRRVARWAETTSEMASEGASLDRPVRLQGGACYRPL